MNKEIKILEEIIEEYKSCAVDGLDMQVDVTFREKQCKALENLIKGYKHIKERYEDIFQKYIEITHLYLINEKEEVVKNENRN